MLDQILGLRGQDFDPTHRVCYQQISLSHKVQQISLSPEYPPAPRSTVSSPHIRASTGLFLESEPKEVPLRKTRGVINPSMQLAALTKATVTNKGCGGVGAHDSLQVTARGRAFPNLARKLFGG